MPPKLRVVGANPFATDDDVVELARLKLESSGLTLEDAEKMGWRWETAEQTKQADESYWYLPSLVIPYIDPWTGEPMRARPKWPTLERRRALREPVPKPEKFAKYLSPKGAGVCAFFTPLVKWPDILSDSKIPLVLTEGEIKAAATTLADIPTIGLGGVNSYKAMKIGESFLPELERINWVRREIFVVYDSDALENPNVAKALWDLAEELMLRGALPRTAILPPGEKGKKHGLDDYLLANSADALRATLAQADHLTVARSLWSVNSDYVYVKTPGVVVEKATGELVKPEAFKSHTLTARYQASQLMQNGAISYQAVGVGDAWIRWGLRSEVRRIQYVPGAEPLSIVEYKNELVYNCWCGWFCAPRKGPVDLYKKLFDHLFTGLEPDAKRWALQWFAYPLQFPGAKLLTSMLVHSRTQGVGKSLLAECMRYVYGDNFISISQESFAGSFNEWAVKRQFVSGDDVSSSEKKRDLDRMKMGITQNYITVNEKFKPSYQINDTIQYFWSSNHADVLALEEMDRRFFVHEVTVEPLPREFYKSLDDWIRGPDGGPALFHYLLNVDLSGFDPNGPAPITAAKKQMAFLARGDIDRWLIDAFAEPDAYFKLGEIVLKSDLLSLSEIRACFEAQQGKPLEMSQIGLARRCAAHGIRSVAGNDNVYVPGRPLARYLAVRRAEHWGKSTKEQVKRYLAERAASERFKG